MKGCKLFPSLFHKNIPVQKITIVGKTTIPKRKNTNVGNTEKSFLLYFIRIIQYGRLEYRNSEVFQKYFILYE
jgi:hypothetical protein